ncbi:hypothetical protein [Zoogloea sp.]|uniref:hypothetical protein n=1 Tax=Zoogloea sp. TaxID=49181 RepID=UPI0025FD1259|nr:hypothetical protein [Zoogloea sp.]MCK6393617.1 hypothetical protein [Zoogloea sp.]
MAAPVFELIDNSTFRFGERVVSGHFSDLPFHGKYRYVVEGTSDERARIPQQLFFHDFIDIRPADLPNGISITLQRPRSEFRQVNFAEIKKVDDQSVLVIILCFDYVDWHLPINLQLFSERYRDSLLRQVDSAVEAHIDQADFGLFINCSISVASDVTFLAAYRKADSQILATYRKCLEDLYKTQPAKNETKPAKTDDSEGAKWWFRYVIVPVVGSGAVAAIAAGLMAFVK